MFKKRIERKIWTSFKWRELFYNLMRKDEELSIIISNGLISIEKILIAVDSTENRILIKRALQKADIRLLGEIARRFPLDYDSVDYVSLGLFTILTDTRRYYTILAYDERVSTIFYKEILEVPGISFDNWEIKMLVFPF